ncbi:uncharacterized protein B0T23DRAFT_320390 [Neurospora hispaniola]|uniref:Uncharacterized protein n=1 Tax=Neurospora hispaniola TaxID=588809 RepID=A0AAJ0I3Y4_9PEZI|nr:hypothetical protein B0T23DRAFT_320390 [Neurospora hispaniola]
MVGRQEELARDDRKRTEGEISGGKWNTACSYENRCRSEGTAAFSCDASFNAHLGTGWKPALAPGSSGEISPVGARPVPAQEPGTHTVGRRLRALGAQTGNAPSPTASMTFHFMSETTSSVLSLSISANINAPNNGSKELPWPNCKIGIYKASWLLVLPGP